MSSRATSFIAASAVLAALCLPASANAAEGVAVSSGTLRAGPGSDYPAVDHLSAGDDLEVYGCTRNYLWCDVSNDDNRGWFQGSRIAFVRNGRRVYLPDIAPDMGIGIVGFGAQDYWREHYRDRPFYNQEHRFEHHDQGVPNQGPSGGPPVYQPGISPPYVNPLRQQEHFRPNDQQRRQDEQRRPNDQQRRQGEQQRQEPPRPPIVHDNRPPQQPNRPPVIHNNPPPQPIRPPEVHVNPPQVHNNPPPGARPPAPGAAPKCEGKACT